MSPRITYLEVRDTFVKWSIVLSQSICLQHDWVKGFFENQLGEKGTCPLDFQGSLDLIHENSERLAANPDRIRPRQAESIDLFLAGEHL